MSLPNIYAGRKATSHKHNVSYFVLIIYLLAVTLILGSNKEAAITAFFGFLFGYILQRSRFCFAAGFRDIFMIRNTALTRAILVMMLLTSFGFYLVHLLRGGLLPAGGIIYPVGLHTVAGGVLFGFGLVVAGNCVSGCLMRMGEGYIMQWCTFIGLLAGSALGAWNLNWWGPFSIERSTEIFLPHLIGWPLSLLGYAVLITALYYVAVLYEKGPRKSSAHLKPPAVNPPEIVHNLRKMLFQGQNWSYTLGAVALAITNTLTFFFWGRPAAITSGLTHLSGWLFCRIGFAPCDWYYFQELVYLESRRIYLEHPILYLSVGIVVGSLFAGLYHREFRIRRPKSFRFVLSALAGGVLLGYSSRVAMGCNFGGFWGGVSSFSLHAWVFGLFILCGAYLGGRFFMRYLL